MRIKVKAADEKIQYIATNRLGTFDLYEFCIKTMDKNTYDAVLYYQKEDIYDFILKKFKSKHKKTAHYGI